MLKISRLKIMIYLEIPYVSENNRVDKTILQNEIENLSISREAKAGVFDAIFNYFPREVDFKNEDLKEVVILEGVLHRLGIPYRRITGQQFV